MSQSTYTFALRTLAKVEIAAEQMRILLRVKLWLEGDDIVLQLQRRLRRMLDWMVFGGENGYLFSRRMGSWLGIYISSMSASSVLGSDFNSYQSFRSDSW
jgi:hypothetical protein